MSSKQSQRPSPIQQESRLRRPGIAPGLLLLGAFLLPGMSTPAGAEEGARLNVNRIAKSGEPFVLVAEDASAVTNASPADVARAQELQKSTGQEILWFRRNGKAYRIRDARILQQALAIVADQLAMGAEQARLGAQQAELGQQQRELGKRQAELGQQQRELGTQQAQLAQEPETPPIVARQNEIGARQDAIGEEQDRIGEEQNELGRQADAIGKIQDEIGSRQEEMGKEQESQIQALITEALAAGLAEEIGR
ncbi:MAG TPA: hypothetical protein VLT87_15185 [Thermoanaerobaculia bacterium]|nr:hypothetical protein [Thermoanaerobaculia bacterium]